MATKIQFRRDTAANWTSNDPILAAGEIGLDLTNQFFKIGDGTTVWSSLGAWSEATAFSVTEFTATAAQTVFTIGYTGALEVRRNGLELAQADYTAVNGTDVTLTTGAALDDLISIKVWRDVNVSSFLATEGGTLGGKLTLPELEVTGTGAVVLPTGTLAQRPSTPTPGMIRYSSTAGELETYASSVWNVIGGNIWLDRNTAVTYTYDGAGKVQVMTETVNGVLRITTYVYVTAGNAIGSVETATMVYNSTYQRLETYTYNATDQLTSVAVAEITL
jgi:YD repeat-containing protein